MINNLESYNKARLIELIKTQLEEYQKLDKDHASLKKFVNFQGEVVANSEIEIAELEKERDAALRESKGSLIILDGLKRRIRAAFEVWPDLAMFKDLSCLLNLKSSAVKLEAHNLEQQAKGIIDLANGQYQGQTAAWMLLQADKIIEKAKQLREGVNHEL